jgi:Transglycosylase SLT domain
LIGVNASRITVIATMWLALCAGTTRAQTVAPARDADLDTERLFRAAGILYGLDPDLLAAIAAVESAGNPGAVSSKGAQGLMQLMPGTAARFGVVDSFDPISNTAGAARFINYLRQWRVEHGAAAPLTLAEIIAAYNAGLGAVQKYGGIPPYPETQDYVRKVLIAYLFGDTHSELRAKLRGSPPAPPPARAAASHNSDALAKLGEIQRLRAAALERQQAQGMAVGEMHEAN